MKHPIFEYEKEEDKKKGNQIIATPRDKKYFEKFIGMLDGKGDLIKELIKEKAREREI